MHNTGRAERVIVISIMKSGTHLITELMKALGYRLYGHVRVAPEARPELDATTRWNVAKMIYGDEKLNSLKSLTVPAFNDATNLAWESLAWAWQLRFGMPITSWYSTEHVTADLIRDAYYRTASSGFNETPSGVCWVLHDFDIRKIDGSFIREWSETNKPRIIFNYRDPRDTILSMVNFLSGRTENGLSSFNNLRSFSTTLLSKPSLEERLTYALTDESFPCQADDFKRLVWLLHHPNVCKASFEELVGPEGGGSAEAQLNAAARVMDFLGETNMSPGSVVDTLFNRKAFSFFQGKTGAWRDVFTTDHCSIASSRFGDVLQTYGYPRD